MATLVLELANRLLKGGLEFADLAEEQLREPKKDGSCYTAFREVVNDLFNVGNQVVVFGSADYKMPFSVDTEIIRSPIFYSVSFAGLLNDSAQISRAPVLFWPLCPAR